MKFVTALIILIILVLLSGCESADSYNFHVGDMVTVKKGFYKDCIGYVTAYDDNLLDPDEVTIREISCKNVTMTYLIIEASDLK